MNNWKYFVWIKIAFVFVVLAFAPLSDALAQGNPPPSPSSTDYNNSSANPNADNTRQNKIDRRSDTLTADRQSNSKEDIQLLKQVRRSLERDDKISTMGKNIKVITKNGKVTLRGPVHSLDEKRNIEQIARQFAGPNNVDNQLNVKSNQQ